MSRKETPIRDSITIFKICKSCNLQKEQKLFCHSKSVERDRPRAVIKGAVLNLYKEDMFSTWIQVTVEWGAS